MKKIRALIGRVAVGALIAAVAIYFGMEIFRVASDPLTTALVENSVADTVAARVTADAIQVDTLIVTPIVAAPMLLILVATVLLQGNKKRK